MAYRQQALPRLQPTRIVRNIGALADSVVQGDVVEVDLNDGSFVALMEELRRRGYRLAKRSESEKYLQPFLFKVEQYDNHK